LRVFLDTNVLVSAFAARGLCADLFELVLLEHELILGRNVLRELMKALRQKVKLPAQEAERIVDFVSGEATQLIESHRPVLAPVDSDDAIVLGEAVDGNAEVFVTGDAMLLKVGGIEQLKILSPRMFWELLHSARP
jgi:putative PIN family toxin of toxin-antitoxin system